VSLMKFVLKPFEQDEECKRNLRGQTTSTCSCSYDLHSSGSYSHPYKFGGTITLIMP
jgi:hypothetical protein